MDDAERFDAIHQAGHVVADWALGHTPVTTTIEPESAAVGIVGSAHDGDLSEGALLALAVARYAGEAAALLAGDSAERARLAAFADDARAYECLRGFDADREQLASELREQARRLVRSHWALVERVADCLLRWRTLPPRAIELILDGEGDAEVERVLGPASRG